MPSFRMQGFLHYGCIVNTVGIVEFLCQYIAYTNTLKANFLREFLKILK